MEKQQSIITEYDNNSKLYESFAQKVQQLLIELINAESISYSAITYRLKNRDSLLKKIDLKHDKYSCLKDITDIAGVRIITYYSEDVDKVIKIIEKEFDIDSINSIDKRKAIEPDRFGYCSVHYIVGLSPERLKLSEYKRFKDLKCEIQLRTVLQHAWAEIEHDLGYKSEIAVPYEIRRNFSRIAGLLELGDKEFSEIRSFLNEYSENVTEKIDKNELNDRNLDIIILKEFIKTDTNIATLNNEIAKFAGKKIVSGNSNASYEMAIKELNWVGITTLRELKNSLSLNQSNAKIIAKCIFEKDSDGEEDSNLYNTIGIFYLCYAELLKQSNDCNPILKYLDDLNIQASDSFAKKLLQIKNQLKW